MEKKKSKVTLGQVFKTIIWPRRKIVFIGLILIIISRLASLVLPGASKYLLDDVVANKDIDMLYTLLWVVGLSIAVNAAMSFLLTKLSTLR